MFRTARSLIMPVVALVAGAWATVGRAEGVGYWNISRMSGQASLFIGGPTEDLEPTTNYGPVPFFCTPKSGVITVQGAMNDDMRVKMADAIKRDGLPPNVVFVPDSKDAGKNYVLALDYHVLEGWLFFFRMKADEAYLKTFHQTGRFVFDVDGARADAWPGPIKRIENVGKFIDACSK
jgi:hypothetical protein